MQTAKDLFQEYQKTANALINQYCQIKKNKPLAELPTLSRMIWKYHTLELYWQGVAKKLSSHKYFQEG